MKSGNPVSWEKAELARRLREARGATTQAELAKKAGVSDRTISAIEAEQLSDPPRPVTVARLALATNCDPQGWLSLIRKQVSAEQLDTLRRTIRLGVQLEQMEIEPAPQLKAELRREIK